MESAKMRRRRSSAARKAANATVISEAMQQAAMKRRASLAARMGSGDGAIQESINQALQNAHRRHRHSIAKAVEQLKEPEKTARCLNSSAAVFTPSTGSCAQLNSGGFNA